MVFYRSSDTLGEVVQQLTKYGISPDKRLAIVEQATTPFQQVYTASPYEYETKWQARKFLSPTLVIIGKVVALHESFRWLENSKEPVAYFEAEKLTNNENEQLALTA